MYLFDSFGDSDIKEKLLWIICCHRRRKTIFFGDAKRTGTHAQRYNTAGDLYPAWSWSEVGQELRGIGRPLQLKLGPPTFGSTYLTEARDNVRRVVPYHLCIDILCLS